MPPHLGDGPRSARLALPFVLVAALLAAACAATPEDPADTRRVTVFGPWRDGAADLFRASMEPFEEATGIDIVYTGSGGFEAEIVDRVQGGAAPDIAVFPQPGLLNQLADAAYVKPLPADIADQARDSYRDGVDTLISSLAEGNGVLYRANVKSLVWYDPAVFAQQQYQPPETWQELQALAAIMIEDGYTPWCLGVEAFGASGWPATDWIEDIVLREAGPQVYDAWVAGDVPFTDEAIASAFEEFALMQLAPGQVVGGRRGILNTSVQQAMDPMFTDPPGCLMYRQASFQVDNLPPGTEIGPEGDFDVFVLPSVRGGEAPLVVGGTVAAAMSDRPETWEVMAFLATAEAGRAWAEAGGFISPHRSIGPEDYPTAFDATVSRWLDSAETVRFDGSDLMDPRVGTGSFYQAMLFFIGTVRLEDALSFAQSGYASDSDLLQ